MKFITIRKYLLGYALIVLAMSLYIPFMGYSANRSSAVSLHEFSQTALNNWYQIANSLEIPLSKTAAGMLEPVIPKKFTALDLVVYGHELVTKDYQEMYRLQNFPRMVNQLHVIADDKGTLKYNVGGLRLLTIKDMGGASGAVMFFDAPIQLIEMASQLYDGLPMNEEGDDKGIIRYARIDSGKYVMGYFLKYQSSGLSEI